MAASAVASGGAGSGLTLATACWGPAAGGNACKATGWLGEAAGEGEAAHQARPAPSATTASSSRPKDGRHAPLPSAPALGPEASGGRRLGLVTAQGAAGLEVEIDQPMRSWPYWFQIGLLPLVKLV